MPNHYTGFRKQRETCEFNVRRQNNHDGIKKNTEAQDVKYLVEW